MVWSIGSGKMTALARLLDAGKSSQTVEEEVSHQKLAVQCLRRELREADEANLLDEEDMHIFGLRPMTDPLDLVCCHVCKKPIKGSQYAAHAELCKSLSSTVNMYLELDGPTVNRKPPRKERKKLLTAQNKKATTAKEPKKLESVDSDAIAVPESLVDDEKVQMSSFPEAKRNMLLNSTHKMNGLGVSAYTMDCTDAVKECSYKHLKRAAAENLSDPGIKNLSETSATVLPYVPAPLATKIYYSQRNRRLRNAICHMFFEESNKESISEVSNIEAQVNAVPTQNSCPSNVMHKQVVNQQRYDHLSHLAQSCDQIPAASSDFYTGKSGGSVPSMYQANQHTMDSTLGPHYKSNSYPFVAKAGKPPGRVQQDSGSVPVV